MENVNIQKSSWSSIMKSYVPNIQLQLLSTQAILFYFEANKENFKNMRYLSKVKWEGGKTK